MKNLLSMHILLLCLPEYDLSEIAELHLANTLLRFEYFQDHGQQKITLFLGYILEIYQLFACSLACFCKLS